MEDSQIIELYWERSEEAIAETAKKYGAFCHRLAKNILTLHEDAEECVNDAWHKAWSAIPPQRPVVLRAWLGRVVRNLAINRWNHDHAGKRYAGVEQLLSELEDCIPSPRTLEHELEEQELTDYLNVWLASLDREDRRLFVRRYWNGEAVKDLAGERGVAPTVMAKRIYRLRQSLRASLEKEGYSI